MSSPKSSSDLAAEIRYVLFGDVATEVRATRVMWDAERAVLRRKLQDIAWLAHALDQWTIEDETRKLIHFLDNEAL